MNTTTISSKIVRRLRRLAYRQVVRFERAVMRRRRPIQLKQRKSCRQAVAVEATRLYLRQKRNARPSHRPKRDTALQAAHAQAPCRAGRSRNTSPFAPPSTGL